MQSIEAGHRRDGRPITGWTVLGWMIAFFAVIFVANGIFIYYAVGTFPGLEVASSYKAGQQFEGEVEAARAQAERGWHVDLETRGRAESTTVIATFQDRDGTPLRALDVSADIEHPAFVSADETLSLTEIGPGRYEGSIAAREVGRRTVVLTASRRGERLFMSRNVVFLAK